MPLGDYKTGPQPGQDGSLGAVRLAKDGSFASSDSHGHFREAVYRGNAYVASNAVAGVAPGTVLSTTPPIIIWNPQNSGVNADIWKCTMGYVSGTLGSGGIVYAQAAQLTRPTGGTALSPVNCLLGNGKTGAIQVFTGSTLAATPTILRNSSFNMDAMTAATASSGFQWEDLLDGEFLLTPGNVFVLQGLAAAGTTPLVVFSITYEETPV